MRTIKIGLLGLGNIGTGTYKTLEMNRAEVESTLNAKVEITKILERDIDRDRGITVDKNKFTSNPDEIFKDPEIDIVIELLGGIEPATTFMISAMENGKHVVTANKAAVAANYSKLMNTAKDNNVMMKFEASVGGGIPILGTLTGPLRANKFEEVMGILNGTTNYILTMMTKEGLDYNTALKDAQDQGFAEADPTADVEGIDAANKLSILMALMFDKYVAPEDIPTTGITEITKEKIEEARSNGCKIKLIAHAQRLEDGTIDYEVRPMYISATHPLANINKEFNAVFVKGNAVDDVMFYGKGAGPLPTGSAVMGDVIEISKSILK
ncbi:MAG: homoserine dehydrogenase [Anaerovoracaceae bacterium]